MKLRQAQHISETIQCFQLNIREFERDNEKLRFSIMDLEHKDGEHKDEPRDVEVFCVDCFGEGHAVLETSCKDHNSK
jgi:hypothetical protein